MIWLTAARGSILPRDPSTTIGMAALVLQSFPFMKALEGMGAASLESLASLLEGEEYQAGFGMDRDLNHRFSILTASRLPNNDDLEIREAEEHRVHPKSLHPALRISFHVSFFAIIVILKVMLRTSRQNKGLGDVTDGSSVHYVKSNLLVTAGSPPPNESYFGVVDGGRKGVMIRSCSQYLRVWGGWSWSTGPDGRPAASVSAMGCN